ncbi:CPBP family intramembrane metalloprotease [Echinicola marina]|uniref:CPBP family intramembrane glutamic endopeptidase n=1 Tax=Echinicola marina TaxID=2859768 RepID=UPI001CF6456E|nr:CPBP family intramembrane glutamic endopeptidase [Echinicola marina]UCS94813.1 CPBP family intramembrane metalloprotease [Echinicola marina]
MPKTFKSTYSDLLLFLKSPQDQPNDDQSFRQNISSFIWILLIDLVIVAGLSGVFVLLEKLGINAFENHKLLEQLESLPKSSLFFLAVLFVPFIEELLFRSYLRYKYNFLLRLFSSLFFIAGKETQQEMEKRIKKLWYGKYRYVFYFSALLFGFIHIFNFGDYKQLIYIFPLLTLPQISFGLLGGYLRVRYGLVWSIILHAFHNMIFLSPLFLMDNGTEVFQKETEDYSVRIEEVSPDGLPKKFYVAFSDSLIFNNYQLRNLISHYSEVDTWQIQSNNEKKMDKSFLINYKNKLDSGSMDKTVVENYLVEKYQFKKSKEVKLTSSWELLIEDTLKLNQYKTDSIKGKYIKTGIDTTAIFRAPLSEIARAIQGSKDKRVKMKSKVPGRFNIKLASKDSTAMKEQLSSVYGLKLVNTSDSVEFIRIEFQ